MFSGFSTPDSWPNIRITLAALIQLSGVEIQEIGKNMGNIGNRIIISYKVNCFSYFQEVF